MNDERGEMNNGKGSSFIVQSSSFSTNERLRQSIHIAIGLFAVTLKWLPWRVAAEIAGAAAIMNWLLLHRIVGKRVARHERGYDPGLVLYPLVVCGLILIFNWHIALAAVAWVILAFGDGVATLAGRAMPIAPLPWNHQKSWGGTIAFIVAAGLASSGMAIFFGSPEIGVAIAATIVAAAVESMPLGMDDNFTVAAAAAGTLAIFAIEPFVGVTEHPPVAWLWIGVNTILAIAGYALHTVDLSGFIAGWTLGTIVILGGGPQLYIALLAFFIVGTGSTLLGYRQKEAAGLAQGEGGRRGAAHAFANVGVAAICALAVWRGLGLVPLFMGIAALATAAADTAGSEIGKLFGRRAFLPLTFRSVPRGTPGAISLEGTFAGAVGALIVAICGTAMTVHEIRPGFMGSVVVDKTHVIVVVLLSGFIASYLESIAGSLMKNVPGHVKNFFNTAAGALLFWIAWNFIPMFGFEF